MEANEAATEHLLGPVSRLVDPYWSGGNRLAGEGYTRRNVGFPFEPVDAPRFSIEPDWTPAELAAFLRSWSAHKRARDDGHATALAEIERSALERLGEEPVGAILPLSLVAGRV